MARSKYLSHVRLDDRITIGTAVAAYCVAAFWLNMCYGTFRVLPYATPFLALIAGLAAGRASLPVHAAPYLVLLIAGLAYAPITSLVGWQDLYLMLMGLSPFMFGYRYNFSWNQITLATVVATVIHIVLTKLAGGGFGPIEFDPLNSRSSFEGTTSFVFGLLAVWAALDRRWRHALFALVLCILTLKRIVVLAAFVTILLSVAMPRRWLDLLLRPVPMILLNALFLAIVIGYTQGHFDRYISAYSGQSANQLGMGRQMLYRYPVEQLLAHPWQSIFIGVGPGGIYDLIKGGWSFLAKSNLHNDSLKILVEYGGVVWVAFFTALYYQRELRIRVVMLFLNIIFLTDNSLIYSYVIFVTGLALMSLRASPPQPVPAAAAPAVQPHAVRRSAGWVR